MKSLHIDAVLRRLEEIRLGSKPRDIKRYWTQDQGQLLGAQYRTQIAVILINRELHVTKNRLQQEALAHHQKLSGPVEIPTRRGPAGERRQYAISTYREWLECSGKSAPGDEDVESVVKSVLLAADALLASKLKPDASLVASLLSFSGTAEAAVERCLELFSSNSNLINWTTFIRSRIIGDDPPGPARGLANKSREARVRDVVETLRDKRSVQVFGPHYSGKHQLLREIVGMFATPGFQTASGARIPLFALSLHEFSPAEVIGHVSAFYADALGIAWRAGTTDEMLSAIGHRARDFPALFVLPGLETVNENEIVRALRQDPLGEMIARIREGHPDTRMLVSNAATSDDDEETSITDVVRGSGIERRGIRFEANIPMTLPGVPAVNYRYRALRQAATALAALDGLDEQDVAARLGRHWMADDLLATREARPAALNGISDFIVQQLNDEEVASLAVVAASPDGLSKQEIEAVSIAFRNQADTDGAALENALAVLDQLPTELVRKPTRRTNGQGTTRYFIEQAFRDHLLDHWRHERPEYYGRACWLLARLAAEEARRLRSRSGLDVSAGRDVQVLILLLASVHGQVESADDDPGTSDEHLILPPLEHAKAAMPSARKRVRFAMDVLFEQDLARSVRHGSPVLNDARLRLAAVHPFVVSDRLWTPLAELGDRSRWRPTTGALPWSEIETTERLRLYEFATAAATRLGLNRLVTHLTRASERLIGADGPTAAQFQLLARIQRYELDLGIQLGRNPDERDVGRSKSDQAGSAGLMDVQSQAEKLIAAIPKKLRDRASGFAVASKLKARRIEILHLRGQHREGYREFLSLSEATRARGESQRLGGRSRRMFLRLLVELARARLFEEVRLPVTYDDKLVLPMLHRSALRPKPLLAAERLANESLRELSIGRPSDWIGAKIDQSRLASVQLNYRDALVFLDEASQAMHARGTTRDIVLELLSVQCRTFVDAAAFAVANADLRDKERRAGYLPEVRALATYLGVGAVADDPKSWKICDRTGQALCCKATEALGVLRGLTDGAEIVGSRYAIFADYLELWITVVRSRLHLGSMPHAARTATIDAELGIAGDRLEKVLAAMMDMGYFLHRREVHLLVEGLRLRGVEVKIPEGFPTALANSDDTE